MKQKLKKLIAFLRDWDNQSRYLKWMVAETRPFFKSLLLILLLDLLLSVTGIGGTVVSKYVIDGAVTPGTGLAWPGVALLAGLTLAGIAVSSLSGILSSYINEKYAFAMRTRVFERVLRSRWQKITSYHSGDVVTRLTSDVDGVANGIASIIPNLIYMTVRLIIAFGVLYHYDRFLAVTALLLGPVGVILSLTFGGRLKNCQNELKKIESEYRSFMQESVENVTVIKTFGQESSFIEKLSALRDRRLKAVIRRNKLNTAMGLCIKLVFSLGYLIAFAWSILGLRDNTITYGTMTLFLSLVSQVQGPIMGLGNIIPQFINVLASTGRIMEIDSLEKEALPAPAALRGADGVGIRFKNVTFTYGGENILDDVSFDIAPCDIVGIVGSSGIGKTTLARIILSLVTPQSGRVCFYNKDGAEESPGTGVRSLISYVPQGNTLISGTIADNLRIGRENAANDEMWEALETAQAGFVRALENGLDSLIGENTVGLSEGQAQRIGIARAIIRPCPVLILDESTSALDAATEEDIIKNLKNGAARTCVVITHRKSMLKFCTKAFEIANGRVRELPAAALRE